MPMIDDSTVCEPRKFCQELGPGASFHRNLEPAVSRTFDKRPTLRVLPGTGSGNQLVLEPGTSKQQNSILRQPWGFRQKLILGASWNRGLESAVADTWFYSPLPAWCKTQEPVSTGRPTCDILAGPPFRPSESISGPPRFPNPNYLGPFPLPPHYHPEKI